MDTGRNEEKSALVQAAPEPAPKIYPKLTLDGKSEAYKDLIEDIEVGETVILYVTSKVTTISKSSTSEWGNRIEIEVTDIQPVTSISAKKFKEDFGD